MQHFVKLVRIATACVFVGRAWQHLYWDAPFRALLWDEEWMSPVLNIGQISWSDWISNPAYDQGIQHFIFGIGVLYLLCGIATILLSKDRWYLRWLVAFGGIMLMLLAGLYTKEKFYHFGQFFEYSLQWGSPFILLYAMLQEKMGSRGLRFIRWAIALTFVCHGLYAYGYYPRPADYVRMMMNGFFVPESTAVLLLVIAGIADFVVGIILVSPWKKWHQAALIYCIIWGALTAFGRVWANLFVSEVDTVVLQWLHQTLYRVPHFLIPLALYSYNRLNSQNLSHPNEIAIG